MNERQRIFFRFLVLPFLFAMLMPYTLKNWMFAHSLEIPYYFIVSLLMSFGLVPLFFKLGIIMNITDRPGGRRLHQRVTPRTGGIAIIITFVAILNIVTNPPAEFKALFWASSIIAIIGTLDDIRSIPAGLKLLGQIAAAAVLISNGFLISFIPDHLWGHVISITISLLWIIGITNAINFLDGLDGLASGLAIVITFFYALISHAVGSKFVVIASIIFMGSVCGFFPYNFRLRKRALIFLGDTGSTFIGFMLAAFAIYGDWGIHKSVDLVIPLLLLTVPITDIFLTNIMRIVSGKVKSVRELLNFTGNDHLHHRLKNLGLRPKNVVLIICLVTCILGLLCLLIKRGDLYESIIALTISAIIIFLIIFLMINQERVKIT
jgi:UDP-GlcNAc:undecaprenyl-phosphate GlcNAc-1-phosphate transferase